MYVSYTPEQVAFQRRLRSYFAEVVTPEVAAGLGIEGGPAFRPLVRRLGRDGWLGLGLPTEWGGQARPWVEQLIFADEADRAWIPLPHITLTTVAPVLLEHGTDQQRERFLPAIAAGESLWALGYTEPSAGTDLANLQTRAVRDGDSWVINGQKLYTSYAADADHIWLAARTDAHADGHRGISVFVVPTDTPGFSWTPIPVVGDHTTTATYYQDVRVPAENLVGPENGGWKLITSQLNRERVVLFGGAVLDRALDEVTAWARATRTADGRRIVDREWVQLALAEVRARNEVSRLMAWQLAGEFDRGTVGPAGSAANKVFTTENGIHCYRLLLEVLGPAAPLRAGAPGAFLQGRIDSLYRYSLMTVFGGGANDVLREFITTRGLGMPRSPR